MKAKECIEKPRTGKWIKRMALAAAAFIVFSYLYSRGISPVWTAVAIVCFRGFFRFLYKIACLLVAAAILCKHSINSPFHSKNVILLL